MVGVTTIIPTVGRESVFRTIDSLAPQIKTGDEVVVGLDSPGKYVLRDEPMWLAEIRIPGAPLGAYGHAARNWILNDLADADHFPYCWSIDDDDIAAPGALDTIRTAIESFPGAWFIFQMEGGANSHWHGLKVPHSGPKILPGNVGTPCIVWPASAESRWGTDQLNQINGPGYYGDYQMAAALHAELGDPVWIDEVIAIIRP